MGLPPLSELQAAALIRPCRADEIYLDIPVYFPAAAA